MGILAKPSWLNPADMWVNQGEKNAPIATLPDGKILAPVQKRTDVTPGSIVGRMGVVGVLNYDAPAAVRHGFHHTVDVLNFVADKSPGGWNNWTRNEMRAAAESYAIMPVEGNDFGETQFGFPAGSNPDKWFYERRKEMFAEAGRNPTGIVRRDYGQHGQMAYQGTNHKWEQEGVNKLPTDPIFRNAYQSVAAARQGVPYFNTNLDSTRYEDLVGCNVKCYPEAPDYARMVYSKLYAIQRNGKAMGKVGGLGPGLLLYNDWAKMEGVDSASTHSVENGLQYHRRINNPPGFAITGVHPQVDFDWQVGCYLLCGFLYGSGVCTFDVASRFGVDPSKMYRLNTPGTPGNDQADLVAWQPDVPGTPAPVTSDGYPAEPNRWHDAGYESAYYWSRFNRTEGVGCQPLSYRFNGSETWIDPPADGASILEHASAFDTVNATAQGARRGRPIVEGRWKNSALDFVVFDPSRGKMYSELIYVKGPNGQQYPSQLRGCIPNAHNETIS